MWQKLGESAAAFKGKLVRHAIEHDLLALEVRLLFNGTLGSRNRFETLIRNRLTALDERP